MDADLDTTLKRLYEVKMNLQKEIATKIVTRLLKLPRRLSEMTPEQIQLVELTCIRAKIDPELKRHVSVKRTDANETYPTVLKLTKAATLGYWRNIGVTLVLESLWDDLDNLYFIEDAPLIDPTLEVQMKYINVKDPYRVCTEAYLKGEYIPLRTFKHKAHCISYVNGIPKETLDFLGFEAPFKGVHYEGELCYQKTVEKTSYTNEDLGFSFAELTKLQPQPISKLQSPFLEFVKKHGEPRAVNEEFKITKSGSSYIIYLPKRNLIPFFEEATQLTAVRHHFYDDIGLFTDKMTVPAKKYPKSEIDRDEAGLIFARTMVELYYLIKEGYELNFDYTSIHAVVHANLGKVESTLYKLIEDEEIISSAPDVGVMISTFANLKPGKRARGKADYTGKFSYPVEYVLNIRKGIYLKLPEYSK